MKIKVDPALFRPVTIRLESQDELDMLLATIENVAENKVNHLPQIITAAKQLLSELYSVLPDGDEE